MTAFAEYVTSTAFRIDLTSKMIRQLEAIHVMDKARIRLASVSSVRIIMMEFNTCEALVRRGLIEWKHFPEKGIKDSCNSKGHMTPGRYVLSDAGNALMPLLEMAELTGNITLDEAA